MTSTPDARKSFVTLLAVLLLSLVVCAADKPSEVKGGSGIILPPPPAPEAKPVTEDIHGTTLTDPYRWLEDGKSPETRAWIGEQMKYADQISVAGEDTARDRQGTDQARACGALQHSDRAWREFFFLEAAGGRKNTDGF